jgi:hypothetical protein
VQLVDSTARANEAANDSAPHDVLPTLPSIPEPTGNATEGSGDSILDLLSQVVDKTKITADLADKTAKVHLALPLGVSPMH